jgi:GntR family transcriptional regulator
MLRRAPSLTDQAKSLIKERILTNQFEGDRIPSETDLAAELGVSRTTIRDALSRLEIEGVIYRKQGSGTFVNRPGLRIKSRLEEIWSYEAVLEAHGYSPSNQILGLKIVPADPDVAADLARPAGEPMLMVEKLFLEDQEPVILTRNFIPQETIVEPYIEDDLRRPVFEFLAQFCQRHLNYYLSDIVPVIATGRLAGRLHLPDPTALLSLEEIGYDDNNEPVIKAYSYFRDDLIRLRLIRRKV